MSKKEKESYHDKLATRLAMILQKLNGGEKFTIESLANEFGVSERTIYTDLNKRFSQRPKIRSLLISVVERVD